MGKNKGGIRKSDRGNKTMKQINVNYWHDVPSDFTGITEYPNGTKEWVLNRILHRVDGPAREWFDGLKEWYLNGLLHRVDGPAVEYPDGRKEWWLNDKWMFTWLPDYRPFVFIEETVDKQQIKVLTAKGTEYWKNVPGLKELAENWEK